MKLTEDNVSEAKRMRFALRPLQERDIPQVEAVEKNAFPTLWPLTSFDRELRNRIAGYLVAWEPMPAGEAVPIPANLPGENGWQHTFARLLGLRSQPSKPAPGAQERIAGFVGIWFMTDEAHIVSVGVHESYRRQGIGELLLIGGIELAARRGSRIVTLEVRASNDPAKTLYAKYGFQHAGIRKRYYADNHEDAIIMNTTTIAAPAYKALFADLVRLHQERWGPSERMLSAN